MISVFLMFLMLGVLFAQEEAALRFDHPNDTFGEIYQNTTIAHRFKFTNFGQKSVTLQHIHIGTPGGKGYAQPEVVPPGGSGEIYVEVRDNHFLGKSSFRIGVDTDDPAKPHYPLSLSGFVLSAFDPETLHLDFGVVEVGKPITLEHELFCREVSRLEIQDWEVSTPLLHLQEIGRAGVAHEGSRLRFTLKPKILAGLISGSLKLKTNVPHQPLLTVIYSAKIFGDVIPSEAPIDMRMVRLGETARKTIRLRSRSGKALNIKEIKGDDAVSVTRTSVSAEPDKVDLVIEIKPSAKGAYQGDIMVYAVGESTPTPLTYKGLVLPQSARVTRLRIDEEDAQ